MGDMRGGVTFTTGLHMVKNSHSWEHEAKEPVTKGRFGIEASSAPSSPFLSQGKHSMPGNTFISPSVLDYHIDPRALFTPPCDRGRRQARWRIPFIFEDDGGRQRRVDGQG